MSPCRRGDGAGRRPRDPAPPEQSHGQPGRAGQAGPRREPAGEPAVRRYCHPIRTARPGRRDASELLAQIQGSLDRQSALLEELLRRTGGNNPDTN